MSGGGGFRYDQGEDSNGVLMTISQAVLDWSQCPVLESVPGKVSGAWVFRGTRVPVSAVLKNLKDLNVNEVVEEFPSVTRDQVRSVLDFIARSADPVATPR